MEVKLYPFSNVPSYLLGSPNKGLAKSHPYGILWWLNIHQRGEVQFLGWCRHPCSLSMLCNLHRIIFPSTVETFLCYGLAGAAEIVPPYESSDVGHGQKNDMGKIED